MRTKTFTVITISRDTHQRLVNLPLAMDAKSTAVFNDDGSVSFPVGLDVHAELLDVHDDMDLAIQILLGLKTN